jgi:hypothetical protein
MNEDPRAENCRRYALNAEGKVIGVELVYYPNPIAEYELLSAVLVDETQSGDSHIAKVIGEFGSGAYLWMAWPHGNWAKETPFADHIPPGNPNQEFIISNPYQPPVQGWTPCIYIGDAEGNVHSDVIGNIALPGGRHVSYRLTFSRRSDVIVPPYQGDISARVAALEYGVTRIKTFLNEWDASQTETP